MQEELINFSRAMDGYAGTGPAATSFGYGAGWRAMLWCPVSASLLEDTQAKYSRAQNTLTLDPYCTFTVTVSTQIDPSTFRIPSSG